MVTPHSNHFIVLPKKARAFANVRCFHPSLIFDGKASRLHSKTRLLALPLGIRLERKRLTVTDPKTLDQGEWNVKYKRSDLFQAFVNYGCKKLGPESE